MNRVFQLRRISGRLVKESETHRIMSIGNRESHRMIEQSSRRRQECFAENHWRDSRGSNKSIAVVECFGSSPHRSSEEALEIPRGLTISGEPFGEVSQHFRYAIRSVIVRALGARARGYRRQLDVSQRTCISLAQHNCHASHIGNALALP